MSELLAWLAKNYPELFAVAVLIFVVSWLSIKSHKVWIRFSKTEEQCNQLRNSYIPDLHNKFSSIESKLNQTHLIVAKISTHLITQAGLSANIFEAKSPIRLTSLGEKILSVTGGKAYIDKHETELVAEIEKREPKSGLDVQTLSNTVITEKGAEDDFTAIKDYLYEHPLFEVDGVQHAIPIDMALITQIMGFYLRDRYFIKYPELIKDL